MIDRELTLEGFGVRLEPLSEGHLLELAARCNDECLWELPYSLNPFTTDADARKWLETALTLPNSVPFAIRDIETGETIGSTRYLDIEPANRKLEIGWTFLQPDRWRTHVNTACKFLLLRHAFESGGCLRVQFKAEAVNLHSRRAIERIGATFEGVLRKFRTRANGEVRDTSVYSVLDTEWPAVKTKLLTFLDRIPDIRVAG